MTQRGNERAVIVDAAEENASDNNPKSDRNPAENSGGNGADNWAAPAIEEK